RLEGPGDFVRLEIEAALKRDIVVMPVLVQGAHMPSAEQLPPEIRDLAYRNGFELSHTRWESDIGEMIRRLDLDVPKLSRQVEHPPSRAAASNASIARTAEPRRRFLPLPIKLTRRQALGIAALAAAGAGVTSPHRPSASC